MYTHDEGAAAAAHRYRGRARREGGRRTARRKTSAASRRARESERASVLVEWSGREQIVAGALAHCQHRTGRSLRAACLLIVVVAARRSLCREEIAHVESPSVFVIEAGSISRSKSPSWSGCHASSPLPPADALPPSPLLDCPPRPAGPNHPIPTPRAQASDGRTAELSCLCCGASEVI